MTMDFAVGDRLSHPTKPDWGLGQILNVNGSTIIVHFENVGEKALRIDYVELRKVEGAEAKSVFLDALRKSKRKPKRARQSLQSLKELFLMEFPGGFYGEKFASHERDYKMAGHELALDLLKKEDLNDLLGRGEHDEICLRARRVIEKLNLPSQFETMKLRSGVKGNEKLYAEELVEFLYGPDDFTRRFDRFCDILSKVNGAKWPIITYYPFITFPAEHMFLKPEVTQAAADACGFELMYRPDINSRTYSKLLDFSRYLLDQLSDLSPRDMIDIQSFIWCVEKVSRGEY
jgi:hypothetical protein